MQLADALVVLNLARGADPEAGVHSATAIKAIRWVRRNLEVHCLDFVFPPDLQLPEVQDPTGKKGGRAAFAVCCDAL